MGLDILKNLVSTYPYVFQALAYAGVFYGVILLKRSFEYAREQASAGIGVGQSEKELGKKARNHLIFGMIFINFFLWVGVVMNTLGLSTNENVVDGTNYLARDVFESADNASDLLMYIVWTLNALGVWWMWRGTYILHDSTNNPHQSKVGIGIKLYVAAAIALNIKLIAANAALWLNLDFIAKWLGYN